MPALPAIDYVGLLFILGIPLALYSGLRFRYRVRTGREPPLVLDMAMAALVGLLVAAVFYLFQPPTGGG